MNLRVIARVSVDTFNMALMFDTAMICSPCHSIAILEMDQMGMFVGLEIDQMGMFVGLEMDQMGSYVI